MESYIFYFSQLFQVHFQNFCPNYYMIGTAVEETAARMVIWKNSFIAIPIKQIN